MVQVFEIRGDLLVATMSGRVSVKKAVQLGKDIGTKAVETQSRKVLVDCQQLTGSLSAPTPAFSGWHSAALIFLIPFVLVPTVLSIPPVFLE